MITKHGARLPLLIGVLTGLGAHAHPVFHVSPGGTAWAVPKDRPRIKYDGVYDTPCPGLAALKARTSPTPAFKPGEELAYDLTVSGVYVGRLETRIGKPRKVSGRNVLPLFGRARTNSFVSTFQPFTGRYQAIVDSETLTPVGLRVESTYGTEPRWERVQFAKDRRQLEASFLFQGEEGVRSYQSQHMLTDVLTLFYWARTFEIEPGVMACQDVFGARRLWRMDAEVTSISRVSTPAGDREAFLVRTTFDRKPHPGFDNQKRPRIDLDVYLSRDDYRAPLAFTVRTEGVTAEATLTRWSNNADKDDDWDF